MWLPYIVLFFHLPHIYLCQLLNIRNLSEDNQDVNFRLDDTIKPSHYEIEIKPYLLENIEQPEKRFTFDGNTKITLSTRKKDVNHIVLHAKDLNITKTELTLDTRFSPDLDLDVSESNNLTDKFTISLKEPLEPNKDYILKFTYSGKMENITAGLYLTSYVDDDYEIVYIASTQFGPKNARKVFPCFDEPKFKATFQLQINRENKYTSTSNMKISHTIPLNEYRSLDIFKTTPFMSTYIVGFLISNFKIRESESGDFSIVARSSMLNKSDFAFENGPKILRKLSDYTDMPYNTIVNMEKLDLVAVLKHRWGAMEHFGFITFPERNLLLDLSEGDIKANQNLLLLLGHEMAHMWFGALVTPDWWNYNWLKEGFATYFSYFIANEVFPEYELEKQFPILISRIAYSFDSYGYSHALVNRSAENIGEFHKMFDSNIYTKSPSIVRMIAHMMGPEPFQNAMRRYLKRNQYRTATNEDLLKALNDEWNDQNLDLRTFLSDWTEQPGYPLVFVNLSDDGRSMSISQKRYLSPKSDKETSQQQYTIPFTYTTNVENNFERTKPRIYLQKNREQKIQFNYKTDWVIGNIQQTGFYRVNYDERTWLNLMEALKTRNFGGIHEINRAQIIYDILSSGNNKLLDFKLVFQILEYLENEYDYLPWLVACEWFDRVLDELFDSHINHYRNFQLKIVNNVYDRFSPYGEPKENEKPCEVYQREQIQALACKAGHRGCIKNAKVMFDEFIYNKKAIPCKMQPIVFCTVVREYGRRYSNYLWNIYKFKEERTSLESLGCTKNRKEFYKVLDFALHEKKSRWELQKLIVAHDDIDDTLQYAVDNYNLLSNKTKIYLIVEIILDRISTEKQYAILKKFCKDHSADYPEEMQIRMFEQIDEKLTWRTERFSNLLQYLEEEYSSAAVLSFNFALILTLIFISKLIQ